MIQDPFEPKRIEPSACIPNEVLLFDNYGAYDPVQYIDTGSMKLYHMGILCMLRGEMRLNINGEDVTIKGGQALTTLPETELFISSVSDDKKYLSIIIYPDLLHKTYEDIYLNNDKTTFDKGFMLGSCNEEEMSIYQIIYSELKKECLRPDYEFKIMAVRSYLNALLINNMNLYDISDRIDIDPSSRQYDVYQKFLKALNIHAKKERTVKFYADLLGISPKYLSFVCLQYSRKNASQWISEYVVHNAKTLMNIHHLSVAETAEHLNFHSINSFNRFFKRVTNQSPREYLAAQKNRNGKGRN
jgi:AraC-like DNA-binding protein